MGVSGAHAREALWGANARMDARRARDQRGRDGAKAQATHDRRNARAERVGEQPKGGRSRAHGQIRSSAEMCCLAPGSNDSCPGGAGRCGVRAPCRCATMSTGGRTTAPTNLSPSSPPSASRLRRPPARAPRRSRSGRRSRRRARGADAMGQREPRAPRRSRPGLPDSTICSSMGVAAVKRQTERAGARPMADSFSRPRDG